MIVKGEISICFSKHLAGKKVQIEAFRETPSIIQPPNLGTIKSVTIKAKEKATLIQKLTSDLFISAECCDGDEGDLSFIDKNKTVKLQHGGLLFPFNSIPQNHPDNFKTNAYIIYNYYLPDDKGKASTFGYKRGSSRIHAARDLYCDVNEDIVAIADGIVLTVENFYMKTDVIVVEHEYETKHAKGYKMVVRYGEVDKGTIKVKKGDKVYRGEKIAEVGQLIQKNGTNFQQPSGENRGMLHIEFYTGEVNTTFKPGFVDYKKMKHAKSIKYSKGRSFKRRIDLFDGLDLLDKMLQNSKQENRIK